MYLKSICPTVEAENKTKHPRHKGWRVDPDLPYGICVINIIKYLALIWRSFNQQKTSAFHFNFK